ncbi:MAG: TetR/AcrR family transcriptional regulator [Acutalibacteraceae bacterium]
MPPKARFKREDIINIAYEIASKEGIEAVTAQAISKKLKASVSPIFTQFNTIEEIREAVKEKAWSAFSEYLKIADEYNPTFKMRGIQMIKFAQDEPKLFRLLFMSEEKLYDFNHLMPERIHGFEEDISLIQKEYGVSNETARHIFDSIWIYAYGICSLCAMKVCSFTQSEISSLLGEMFAGTLYVAKLENKEICSFIPAKKGTPEGDKLKGLLPF